MADPNPTIPTITYSVNGANYLNKTAVSLNAYESKTQTYAIYETHFRFKGIQGKKKKKKVESSELEKVYQANNKQNRARAGY